MKITPETVDDIVTIIAHEFRSFGGGRTSQYNPIANALADKDPQFAAGVDIKDVVERVIQLNKQVVVHTLKS